MPANNHTYDECLAGYENSQRHELVYSAFHEAPSLSDIGSYHLFFAQKYNAYTVNNVNCAYSHSVSKKKRYKCSKITFVTKENRLCIQLLASYQLHRLFHFGPTLPFIDFGDELFPPRMNPK